MVQYSEALVRSRPWDDDCRVERKTAMAPLGKMIKDRIGPPEPAAEVEGYIPKYFKERLYRWRSCT